MTVRAVRPVLLVLALTTLLGSPLWARRNDPEFHAAAFQANEATVRWLRAYDSVAWLSSDLVMEAPQEQLAKLGPEWFCYEGKDGAWHAVYGRYHAEAGEYQPSFHYVKRSGAELQRTDEAVDAGIASKYGKALHHTLAHLPDGMSRLGIPFNSYVRSLEDGRVEVWVLPGGQADGSLVYGGDGRWVFDATGTKLLIQESNFREFSRVNPDPELQLDIDRQENDVPSVGDIFFLLTFRSAFRSVTVWTRCFLTTVVGEGEATAWVHVQRDAPECGVRKKRRGRESRT